MRRFLFTPLTIFCTIMIAGFVIAQAPAPTAPPSPVIPNPPQFSMTTVNSIIQQKDKQLDDYQITNTLQAEQIEQLKSALIAKQTELQKAQDSCASSSATVKAPDKKGK